MWEENYRVYAPDLHTTIVSSYKKLKEDIKGSTIVDLKLWKESGIDFSEGKGNSAPAIRKPIGRPKIKLEQIQPSSLSYSTGHRSFKTDNATENMENLGLVKTDEIKTSYPILNELNDAGKLREDGRIEFTNSDFIPSLEKFINFNDENVASIQTQDTSQIIAADKGNQELSQSQEDLLVEQESCERLDRPKLIDKSKFLRRSKRLQLKSKELTNHAKFEQIPSDSKELEVVSSNLDTPYSSEEPLDLEIIETENWDSSGETIHEKKVKRKRSVSDDKDIEYQQAKIQKAILAILELSDSQNDMNIENAFVSETLP
ncbi:hypothetical protein Golomagni_00276 [Golovinomyces magnicellulatus]|nr:hypothetical protein Golomagni_00276 [Golovinomyces magnicellulatus]